MRHAESRVSHIALREPEPAGLSKVGMPGVTRASRWTLGRWASGTDGTVVVLSLSLSTARAEATKTARRKTQGLRLRAA